MADETQDRTLEILLQLPPFGARIEAEVPNVRLHAVPMEGPLDDAARGEVLLTLPWASPNLSACLERGVRWIHTFGTGVDGFPFDALSGQQLTCSRGASAVPISEWVLANMLSFEKHLPASWIANPPPQWNHAELGGLHGRTLGLVGFGEIARAVAERALVFGMRVLAHRRSDKPSDLAGVTIVRDLDALISEADHVVIAASATPETRHMIGARELAALKPGAHLVNIARGSLIDQEALREALDSGPVALASLDVCEPEPLPAGHWLYTHPKVHLSAHISWSAPGSLDRLLQPFIENLHRYRRGEALLGEVDIARGY